MLKSYYEILQVSSNATKSEIKKQFKKLVKMYHPDVNQSIEAEAIFKEINKAAEILLDDEKRNNYDSLRAYNKNIYTILQTIYQISQKKAFNYETSCFFLETSIIMHRQPQSSISFIALYSIGGSGVVIE